MERTITFAGDPNIGVFARVLETENVMAALPVLLKHVNLLLRVQLMAARNMSRFSSGLDLFSFSSMSLNIFCSSRVLTGVFPCSSKIILKTSFSFFYWEQEDPGSTRLPTKTRTFFTPLNEVEGKT